MTTTKFRLAYIVLLASCMNSGLATAAQFDHAKHIDTVSMLPAAVLTAVESAHPEGVIVHVYHDQHGPRYGRSEYYVNIVSGEQVHNMGLTAAGVVLKDSLDNRTERIAQLPDAVRAAARAVFTDAVIFGAGSRNNIFQVNVLADGLPYDLEVTRSGEVLSKKRKQG
ncbi:MAG: hypothetical protein MPJ50_18680 [Pirellulales bacterium]|nr:hypothetical protein [Pirellulales bacterium]